MDRPWSIGSASGGSARRGLRVTARTAPTIGNRRRAAAFWSVAYAYLVIMLGTTLPSPLYGLYQDRFSFDAGMLTVVFAAYAGGVLVALLLFGGLSDRVGRRPVVAAALIVAVLSGLLVRPGR